MPVEMGWSNDDCNLRWEDILNSILAVTNSVVVRESGTQWRQVVESLFFKVDVR